jgi:hypothetical protein
MLLTLLGNGASFAAGIAGAQNASGPVAYDSVAQDLLKVVRTVPQDIYFYHAVTRDRLVSDIQKTGKVDPEDGVVRDHVRKWSDYFNNPSRDTSRNAGLYLSNEPLSTQHDFGGPDFVLYRVGFPKGTRYIDNRDRLKFSQASISELQQQGCSAFTLQDLVGTGNPGRNISEGCAVVLSKYMKQLHIAHLSYKYESYKIPGCDSHEDVAIVLAQPDLIPKSNIQVFTADPASSGPAHDEAVMISKMAMKVGVSNPYSSLVNEAIAVNDEKYKAWLGKHIQGCQNLNTLQTIAKQESSPCHQSTLSDVSEKINQLGSHLSSMLHAMLSPQASRNR